MTYADSTSQLLALCSVQSSGGLIKNQTWVMQSGIWTLEHPLSDAETFGGRMAYDPATHQVVLFSPDAQKAQVAHGSGTDGLG